MLHTIVWNVYEVFHLIFYYKTVRIHTVFKKYMEATLLNIKNKVKKYII